jgi:hypothetical protein
MVSRSLCGNLYFLMDGGWWRLNLCSKQDNKREWRLRALRSLKETTMSCSGQGCTPRDKMTYAFLVPCANNVISSPYSKPCGTLWFFQRALVSEKGNFSCSFYDPMRPGEECNLHYKFSLKSLSHRYLISLALFSRIWGTRLC